MIYHIQKDSLDAQNRQNVWLLIFLLVSEAFDPVRMGPQGDFCLNNNNNNDKIYVFKWSLSLKSKTFQRNVYNPWKHPW